MGSVGEKWNQTVSNFRRSDLGSFFQGGGSVVSQATGINIDINKAAERAIGGPLESLYRAQHPDTPEVQTVGTDQLINQIDEETRKTEKKKADLAARALADTMNRLNRERRPGMASKNSTIKTGPMGVPTSMLQKRPTLLGS